MGDEKHGPVFPDFFADGISIGRGPFGVSLTFLRSEPPLMTGPPEELVQNIVGRVRISDPLAVFLVQKLSEALAQPLPPPSDLSGPQSASAKGVGFQPTPSET